MTVTCAQQSVMELDRPHQGELQAKLQAWLGLLTFLYPGDLRQEVSGSKIVPVGSVTPHRGNRSLVPLQTPLLGEPLLLQTLWPGGSPLLPTTPPLLIPFLASLCLGE